MTTARYDGIADWYDATLSDSDLGRIPREASLRLLGDGPGRLLDVGCGTGTQTVAFANAGWTVTGVDVSEDMARLARKRGVETVVCDATALPFGDESFDAVVSVWTHTDVDGFDTVLREIHRVLRPEGPFVYVGAHPCFIGPHSRFVGARGIPGLYAGYLDAGRYSDAPGVTPNGLREKVGAVHLPLGTLLQSFVDAGFRLELFEELDERTDEREYPFTIATRWRR